jgi:hypothetical protein
VFILVCLEFKDYLLSDVLIHNFCTTKESVNDENYESNQDILETLNTLVQFDLPNLRSKNLMQHLKGFQASQNNYYTTLSLSHLIARSTFVTFSSNLLRINKVLTIFFPLHFPVVKQKKIAEKIVTQKSSKWI